jgi:acyl-CoA thioesterase
MYEEQIKNSFNQCNVGKLIGIDIYEIREGFAKGKLKIRREHINIFGNAHGGILFTFADHIGGACGNTLGKKAVLVESSIQYMKGVLENETVFADAVLTYKGARIGRIEVKIYKKNMDLIAIIHQIFFIKDDKHEKKVVENI